MDIDLQRRLGLLAEAREYSKKMEEGSVFRTDFSAMHLLDKLIFEMQELLAENLKFKEELVTKKAFRKKKKEPSK